MSDVLWLHYPTDDEGRVCEKIRSFEQLETQDALGFGQVRDTCRDPLLPGVSTLHMRAKNLLLVPVVRDGRGDDPSRH